MTKDDHKDTTMTVWCPLIAPEYRDKLRGYLDELPRVNTAYEDWLSSIRGKPVVGVDIGVILDRIRMLMINIGIAFAQNRALAEAVQSVVSEQLRTSALKLAERLPDGSQLEHLARAIVEEFFNEIKFTRDVVPEEEIESVARKIIEGISQDRGQDRSGFLKRALSRGAREDPPDLNSVIERALQNSTSIVKKLYVRLLTPNPWADL